jgi:hypothetical protein
MGGLIEVSDNKRNKGLVHHDGFDIHVPIS